MDNYYCAREPSICKMNIKIDGKTVFECIPIIHVIRDRLKVNSQIITLIFYCFCLWDSETVENIWMYVYIY